MTRATAVGARVSVGHEISTGTASVKCRRSNPISAEPMSSQLLQARSIPRTRRGLLTTPLSSSSARSPLDEPPRIQQFVEQLRRRVCLRLAQHDPTTVNARSNSPPVAISLQSRGRKRKGDPKVALIILVGAPGFEPGTPRSRTECSTRLSHAPTLQRIDRRRNWSAASAS